MFIKNKCQEQEQEQEQELIAYARIIGPNIIDHGHGILSEPSIGRVLVKKEYRSTGIGHKLMIEAIKNTKKLYPNNKIKISAQRHLEKFYNKSNFFKSSDIYLEDNIEHIEMIYNDL